MGRWLWPMAALALLLAGCGKKTGVSAGGDTSESVLTVYVAASLTDVIQEIGKAFEVKHGCKLVYNFSSSGALAQQIMAAPRADVYLSANERWMDKVEKAGEIMPGTRHTLLHGALVVIANPVGDFAMSGPLELPAMKFSFLSMGDPGHVPAGSYAKKWLQSVTTADGESVWRQVESRVSPAPDVRAALSQVEGKADVIGVVYRTDYIAHQDKVKLLYQVPPNDVVNIAYSVAALKASQHPDLARAFVDYLFTPESQQTLSNEGFIVGASE